jgi:hypothetical protein
LEKVKNYSPETTGVLLVVDAGAKSTMSPVERIERMRVITVIAMRTLRIEIEK